MKKGYEKWDRDRGGGGGGGGGVAGSGSASTAAWSSRDRERDRERERQARAHQMSHAHAAEPDASSLFPAPIRVTGHRDKISQHIQTKLGDYHLAQTFIDDPSKSIGICAEPASPAPCLRESRRESEFKKPAHAPQNGRVHHRPYGYNKNDGASSTGVVHRPPPLRIPNGFQAQSAIDSSQPPIESILKEMKSLPTPLSVIAATPRKELENKFIFNPYTNKVQENPQLSSNDLKSPNLPKPGLDNRISNSRSSVSPDVVNKDLGLSESDEDVTVTRTDHRIGPPLSPIGSGSPSSGSSSQSDSESESSSAESTAPPPPVSAAPAPPTAASAPAQRISWGLVNFALPPARTEPQEQGYEAGKELRHALADVKGKPSPISELSDSSASSPSPGSARRRTAHRTSTSDDDQHDTSSPRVPVAPAPAQKRGRPPNKPRASEERPAKKRPRGRPPKTRPPSPPPALPPPVPDDPPPALTLPDTKMNIFRKVFTPKQNEKGGGKGGKGGKGKGGKGKAKAGVTIIEVAALESGDDDRRHRDRSNERRNEEVLARLSPPQDRRREDFERTEHRRSDDRHERPLERIPTERTSNDRIPTERTSNDRIADRLSASRHDKERPDKMSHDRLSVEKSHERLSREKSHERLSGEKSHDRLSEKSHDRLSSEKIPHDRLSSDKSHDRLSSDKSHDRLSGEKFPDRLSGEKFPDRLSGEKFPDRLSGDKFPEKHDRHDSKTLRLPDTKIIDRHETKMAIDRLTESKLSIDRVPEKMDRLTDSKTLIDRLPESKMSIDKNTIDRLTESKLSIDRLPDNKLPIDRLTDSKLTIDSKMAIDRLSDSKLSIDRLAESKMSIDRLPMGDRFVRAEADVGSGLKPGRGSERLEEATSIASSRRRSRVMVRIPLSRLRPDTVRALRRKPPAPTPTPVQTSSLATNHERSSHCTLGGQTPIYYSYFERLPADTLSTEERDHKYYLEEATRLRASAEREQEPLTRVMLYLESVLCFVLTGRVLELELDTKGAFTIYRETIEYIKLIHSMPQRYRASPHDTFNKLDILSLRVQALLYLRMFKMYNREVKEYNKIVHEYQQKPACAESVSPLSPTPSPAGSVGSVGSGASASSGYCSLVHSVPAHAHQALLLLTKYYAFLYVAHDLWEQADGFCRLRANQDLFIAVDRKCGPLSLSSTFRHLVQYVRYAITLLKNAPRE